MKPPIIPFSIFSLSLLTALSSNAMPGDYPPLYRLPGRSVAQVLALHQLRGSAAQVLAMIDDENFILDLGDSRTIPRKLTAHKRNNHAYIGGRRKKKKGIKIITNN